MTDGWWRGGRTRGAAAANRARAIGDPHVAIAIDRDAVRRLDQPSAEALHEISVLVELEDRIERRAYTVVDPAALGDPDARAILVDIHGARRAPRATGGHFRPALDGLIGI